MFCTSCGVKNAADSNFCKQCGGKLAKPLPKISEDAFDRALPDEEQTAALLERAYRLRRAGDLDAAIALCEETLRLREDSTSAHSLLGQLHEEKGDASGAIHEYERVLALNPGSIADRVKLDELRERQEAATFGTSGTLGAITPDAARKPRPRVRLGDHRSASGFDYSRFTSAGVAVVLVGLGSLIALQFHPRSQNAPVVPAVSTANGANNMAANLPSTSVPDAQTAQGSLNAPNAANGTIPVGKYIAPAATHPTSAGSVQTTSPASSTLPASPTAPTIVYTRPEIRYIRVPDHTAPLNIAPASALTRLPGRSGRGHRAAVGANDSDRVVLDSDVTENGGKITVQVGDSDMPDKTSAAKSNEKSNDMGGRTSGRGSSGRGANSDARVAGEVEHIEMEKAHSPTSRAASNPSSIEARSLAAMGDDKKRDKDYRGAIEAFGRALGSAGDQSGYIYQQRALCYQYLNDTSSARADYTHAIDEYRKLEARDPETARLGIRTCQSGIKTCGE